MLRWQKMKFLDKQLERGTEGRVRWEGRDYYGTGNLSGSSRETCTDLPVQPLPASGSMTPRSNPFPEVTDPIFYCH